MAQLADITDKKEERNNMDLYKLTDSKHQTLNATQWGENVTHETSGEGELCGPGWLHAYEHPLLAVLLNPIHADFESPVLWEAIGDGDVKRDGQLKLGVTRLTTTRQIPLPVVTREQRIKFAIMCAKQVCTNARWNAWADRWLSGEDRSEMSAWALAWAEAAAWAAEAAEAAAVWSAWSAADAAAEAARAAEYAVRAKPTIDLIKIAEEAVK